MSWAAPPGCGQRESLDSVDVLFIDEAGQFSLANAVAVSTGGAIARAARRPAAARPATEGLAPAGRRAQRARRICSGDAGGHARRPRPLHGADVAAAPGDLRATPRRSSTRRRCCREAGNERQALRGAALADGEGIRFVAVEHEASRNDTDSPRRREAIARRRRATCSTGATWTDREGRDAARSARRTSSSSRPTTPSASASDGRSRGAVSACATVAGRHRGQVPGPGGAHLHLLHGHARARRMRRAAWSSSTRSTGSTWPRRGRAA